MCVVWHTIGQACGVSVSMRQVYQRLALQFSMHSPEHVEQYLEHKQLKLWGKFLWGCLKKCFRKATR